MLYPALTLGNQIISQLCSRWCLSLFGWFFVCIPTVTMISISVVIYAKVEKMNHDFKVMFKFMQMDSKFMLFISRFLIIPLMFAKKTPLSGGSTP